MKPSEAIQFNRPLWQHQKDALDRFAYENEAALFHEMGTGKTTSAIAWMRAKYNIKREVLPTLIVSPVATLHNWQDEIERNAPLKVSESVQILSGSETHRCNSFLLADKKIFITNPEAFDMKELSQLMRVKIVIVDEAHRFKNFKSKRLQRLLSVTDLAEYRMILTGTPILNSYLDLWAEWRILDCGATFGRNFFVFREKYFRDENIAWKGKPKYFPKYVPKHGIEDAIASLVDKKASRLKKEDCLSLPPIVPMIEYVEMGAEQARAYRQMESELLAEVASGVCVASNALTRVLRMLQILSGYLQVETIENEKFSHRLKENPRLRRLTELLEEITPQAKVIVWCTFQENYRAIRAACEELGIQYAELTGQTTYRQLEIDTFQNDRNCRVMIANPQAGGLGVNLTAASYAIYYSRSYSLGDRLQSEARNHRGGSEIHDKITLIDLVAPNTLDEAVLDALLKKENFSENILARLAK